MTNPQNIFSYKINDIYEEYGEGNLYEFGDIFIDTLNELSDFKNQYSVEFDTNTEHDNPYFHTLIITTSLLTPQVAQKLDEKIVIKVIQKD